MDFTDAQKFVMPFGKYKGQTLDQIAESDAGLKYLDWMRGERHLARKATDLDAALAIYLDHPSIAADLQGILAAGR